MERKVVDPNRGLGRGRPVQTSDLRRPFAYTYTQHEYHPSEGSSNGMRLNSGLRDPNRQDQYLMGEPGVFTVPPEDVHSGAILNNSAGGNGQEKKFELSPFAPEFIPRNFRPEPRTVPPQVQPNNTIDTSSDSYPIQALRQFLFDITLNPGKFESKIQPLADCLNEYIDDDDTMRAIVNIIFDESVRQPNFRYNGARLCKFLSNELNVSSDRSNFRQLLLARCAQEHKRRNYLAQAEDGGAYLRGFAMYLAELFSQLEISNQRIHILGENLTSIMETLLSYSVSSINVHNVNSENLKCICQLLKLVGVYLEDSERNKIPNEGAAPEIEKIFTSLKNVSENQEIPRDIRSMVNSVIELRSTDWGRATENNEPEIEEHTPPSLNEPVMYGPDGKPITAEESLFLHSQYSNHASDPEEYEPYDDNPYDEMEDEMQAAYEVFLNEMAH